MKKKTLLLCSYFVGCILVFLAIFFTVAHFVFAYYEADKTFRKEGLSITLTRDFKEKANDEDYTAYYYAHNMGVWTYKTEFSLFDASWGAENRSCEEYAELIKNDYKTIYESTSDLFIDNGLIYFTFDTMSKTTESRYFVSAYKSKDAFWLVLIGCEKAAYEKGLQEDVIAYAQSVVWEE